MPVSTRSYISSRQQNDPTTGPKLENQEESLMSCKVMRNPHHGLKEKMKELTLLYEQQKQASNALKNRTLRLEEPSFTAQPSVDLVGSSKMDGNEEKEPRPFANVMRENSVPNSIVTRTYVPPPPQRQMVLEGGKENVVVEAGGGERIVGFSCPRRASNVAMKLPLGSSVMPRHSEPRGAASENMQETESVLEKESNGGEVGGGSSRILVFVRLRPLAKKEVEPGARSCVRIVDGRDIYLTEPATENDYLGLKRLRGRHFTFDASFPDSATQQQVYSTT